MTKETNLKKYIIGNYDKIFDLTESRSFILNMVLDSIYGEYIDLEDFKNTFGLEDAGYLTILKYVFTKENFESLKSYGQKSFTSISNTYLKSLSKKMSN